MGLLLSGTKTGIHDVKAASANTCCRYTDVLREVHNLTPEFWEAFSPHCYMIVRLFYKDMK